MHALARTLNILLSQAADLKTVSFVSFFSKKVSHLSPPSHLNLLS
jgi:hypothetical protein